MVTVEVDRSCIDSERPVDDVVRDEIKSNLDRPWTKRCQVKAVTPPGRGRIKDLSKGMRPPVIGHLTAACRLGRLNGDGHRPRRSETMRDQNTGDGRRFPDSH